MAYCRKCGKLLSDNAYHCTVCGTPVKNQPEKFDTGRIPQVSIPPHGYEEETRLGVPSQPQYYPQGYSRAVPQNAGAQPVQPVQQPPKKKNGTLTALYILLGVLIAALLGVGGWFLLGSAPKDDPVLGRYEVVSCQIGGEEAETNGEYVVLRKGGKASLSLETTEDAAWKLDGEDLTIETETDTYSGTLEGDTLTLEVGEKEYTFRKDAYEEEDGDGPGGILRPTETTRPRAQDRTWWEGDWYGWWSVLDGSGEMYLMEQAAWDVCGQIQLNDDGTCSLHIWDGHQGAGQFSWFVEGHFEDGGDERGILVSDSGTFRGAELGGSITVDPAVMPYGAYADLMYITGTYTDPDNSGNSCTYCIVLRPWGTQWDDLRGGDTTGMPYSDMLPVRYESWYLPLIREGASMPDAFY